MIHISPFQIFELTIGLFIFWVGVYQLSQNIKSSFSWIVFFFFFCTSFVVLPDPIMVNTPDIQSYILWQKLTDWPLFLMPALCLNIAIASNGLQKKLRSYILIAYAFSVFLFFADIHGGLVLKENIVRFDDFRRIDSFAPGVLMIPFVLFCLICFGFGVLHFRKAMKEKSYKYIYPIIGLSVLAISAVVTGFSLYFIINWEPIFFNVGLITGISFFIYFIISYYQVVNNERNIFDRGFLYRTIILFVIVLLYVSSFIINREGLNFRDLLFLTFLAIIIIATHALYEWINTFINDLIYNPSSGLSVVNDQEVYEALRSYNAPQKLENSSLLRLKIVSRTHEENSLDKLKNVVKKSIEYFKPEEDAHRRTKQNLKYHLLKMLVFDEAEEGQMLWELGFEEYPVKILSQERRYRPPLFEIKSPSDYTYTSRNAFLALKKEAIHDITWRISYLEKMSKK